MIRVLWAMIVAETRMAARQSISAALVLVLPLITMPGALMAAEVYLGSLEEATGEVERPAQAPLPVRVVGSDEVAGWIAADPRMRLLSGGDIPAIGVLGSSDVHAIARVDGRHVVIEFRSDIARSRLAAERLEAAVRRGVEARRVANLESVGLPGRPEDALPIRVVDHAAKGSGSRFGAILPLLIEFTLVMVALYTALDVISGEKERKTGESLLTAAIDRRLVTAAKGLVTAGAAALSGFVGVGSVVVLAAAGALHLPRVLGEGGGALLTGPALAAVLLATALLALETAGIAIVLAAWVPDYRTGSMLSAPIAVLLLIPAALPLAPAVQGGPLVWMLPIANLAVASRDWLAGTLHPAGGAAVLAASAVHAALAVGVATRLLGRDASLLGRADPRGRRALGQTGPEAFGLFVACLVLMWFFGQLAQASDLVGGMAFTQLALIAAPALGVVAWLGLPWRETLSLGRPHPVDFALGLVAGATMFGLAQLVLMVQDPLLPSPKALEEAFEQLQLAGQPLWVPLLVFAALPALCEELLFRGAMLGLLRRAMKPVPRVLAVALAFGCMHLLLPRILPTAALGVLLGAASLRSRSLWVAVIMHAVNNGLALVAVRSGTDGLIPASLPVLAGAAAVAVGAVAAMGRFKTPAARTAA
jgi:sodium transport system permease protein